MLEARDISFSYGKGKPLIYEGFFMEVQAGERLYIDAPSGFGKTTLCKLLAGYEKPSSGEILVDGKPLPLKGACPVQMIGQHPERMLDPRLTMLKSLEEAGRIDRGLLKRLGIHEKWLTRYPHELSGGEMQRFCIARTLMSEPRYLVADEISTMLDAVTQAQIWKVLLEEASERDLGLVFTTHSHKLAQRIATRESILCDTVR